MKHLFRRVLVTGASGFIGSWIAKALVEKGYAVRALYRRERMPDPLRRLAQAGAEVERRDLSLPEDVQAAVRETEAVIHIAGLASDWGPLELFERQNVEPTIRLLQAAQVQGCRAFVFIGSASVHGFGPHLGSTEEGPYYPLRNPYPRSKKKAEQKVLAANAPGFRTTVIRPVDVYGPGDTTTFYRLLAVQERGFKGTLGGGRRLTSVVYIEDLVQAVILALESEASAGEAFNINGGERVSWAELLGYTASLLGVHPWLGIPLPLAWALAFLLSGTYSLLRIRRDPPLTLHRVGHVAWDFDFSNDKAHRLLGYTPAVSWREGMRRTVEAYAAQSQKPT